MKCAGVALDGDRQVTRFQLVYDLVIWKDRRSIVGTTPDDDCRDDNQQDDDHPGTGQPWPRPERRTSTLCWSRLVLIRLRAQGPCSQPEEDHRGHKQDVGE